jgi:GNAT superfamily N-acetyltransferase
MSSRFSEREIVDGLVYVAEVGGRVLGFYTLGPLNEQDVDIGHFFVEPPSMRKGYGKRLLDHATAVADELGYKTLVIQSDPYAEPFYRAMGAELIGTRPSASVPGRELPLLAIRLSGIETG